MSVDLTRPALTLTGGETEGLISSHTPTKIYRYTPWEVRSVFQKATIHCVRAHVTLGHILMPFMMRFLVICSLPVSSSSLAKVIQVVVVGGGGFLMSIHTHKHTQKDSQQYRQRYRYATNVCPNVCVCAYSPGLLP